MQTGIAQYTSHILYDITSGDGLFAFGSYGHESEEDGDDQIPGQEDSDGPWSALSDPDGVVASVTMDEPGKITAAFAAIIDDPDEDHLESVLGEFAQERSLEIDGDRVSVSATWEGE